MYGPTSFVFISLLLIAAILAGAFFSKNDFKYIILSMLATTALTGYLIFTIAQSKYMQLYLSKEALSFFVYGATAVLFVFAIVALAGWAVQRAPKKQKKPGKASRGPAGSYSEKQTRPARLTSRADIVVFILAGIILVIHLVCIASPSFAIGDEPFYVKDALRIVNGQPLEILEHPPLGKWIIAAGIFIFGDNAFGMRIFSILFGTGAIILFYYTCKALVSTAMIEAEPGSNLRGWQAWFQPTIFIPLVAAFLFATENLSFVQSHLATLDVFAMTFMLTGFLLYLRQRHLLSGITLGLALLCKETAIFGVVVVLLHSGLTSSRVLFEELKSTWKAFWQRKETAGETSVIMPAAKILAAAAVTFFTLLPPMEYVKTYLWGYPINRILYFLDAASPRAEYTIGAGDWLPSAPWEWLIKPDLQQAYANPHYYQTIGWAIWPLIIPSIVYVGYNAVKNRNCKSIFLFTLIWFLVVFGSLALIAVYSGRPMYTFHIYPAVPAVCLAVSLLFWKLRLTAQRTTAAKTTFVIMLLLFLLGTAASFIITSPVGSLLFG